MPHDSNGDLCQCGCGDRLPIGSRRRFKRGHAKVYAAQQAAVITEELKREDPSYIPPAPTDEAFSGLSTDWDTLKSPFENMAEQFPDDPGPDETARASVTDKIPPLDGQIIVTKQIAEDIQGKLAFLLSMPTAMLAPLDPVCMPVIQQNIPQVTAALVPIICQSPDMVKFFTKGAGFILWLNLGVAMWPIIQVIIAHHLSKSITLDANTGQTIPTKDFTQYGV